VKKSNILYETPSIRVEYFHQEENKKIVFIFSNSAIYSLAGNSTGGDFLFSNGFNVLNFKNISLDWYQNLPDQLFEKIGRLLSKNNYALRVAMGHSMGAYAALCFSSRFNFDVCLAYSPQSNIDHNYDFRFSDKAQKIDNWCYVISSKTISQTSKFFLIYDNKDPDINHIRRLKEVIPAQNITEIILPYASHEVTGYLHEIGALKDLSLKILDQKPITQRFLRKNRIKSQRYLEAISLTMLRKRDRAKLVKIKRIITKLMTQNKIAPNSKPADHLQISVKDAYNYFEKQLEKISHKILLCDQMTELERQGFDTGFYLHQHPDVAHSGMSALYHYVCFGQYEGRALRLSRKI
jgi:hypothetical protein